MPSNTKHLNRGGCAACQFCSAGSSYLRRQSQSAWLLLVTTRVCSDDIFVVARLLCAYSRCSNVEIGLHMRPCKRLVAAVVSQPGISCRLTAAVRQTLPFPRPTFLLWSKPANAANPQSVPHINSESCIPLHHPHPSALHLPMGRSSCSQIELTCTVKAGLQMGHGLIYGVRSPHLHEHHLGRDATTGRYEQEPPPCYFKQMRNPSRVCVPAAIDIHIHTCQPACSCRLLPLPGLSSAAPQAQKRPGTTAHGCRHSTPEDLPAIDPPVPPNSSSSMMPVCLVSPEMQKPAREKWLAGAVAIAGGSAQERLNNRFAMQCAELATHSYSCCGCCRGRLGRRPSLHAALSTSGHAALS